MMNRRTFLTATSAGATFAALAPLARAADPKSPAPAIARIWRGRTTRAKADAYAKYLYDEGVLVLKKSALGVQLFREDRADDSEFVVISYWESVEAMARFAGPNYTQVHPLPKDAEYLIELPKSIQVMHIAADLGAR
jgi:hypothetical protein